ncbi:MAG: BatA domain-containing protein [Phycisphaerae bacterium]|nr:BatA domain-containing protein [Phycisphaerae bacterium]
MGFESPWNLLWLVGVAGAAVFALLRPARRRVVVPTLRLWIAAGAESQSASHSRKRIALPWILLLLGAVLAAFALSKPVIHPPAAKDITTTPAKLQPITLDAFAAEMLPSGQVEIFVSLRNNTGEPQKAAVKLEAVPNPATPERDITIAPNTTGAFIERIPTASIIELTFGRAGSKNPTKSQLVQRSQREAKVAVVGPLSGLLRRYVSADDILQLTPNPKDADVLIANGLAIPANWTKPALSINPPKPLPGWRRGETMQNVVLISAHGAAGPILKNVDLSAVAIRKLTPWIPIDNPTQIIVARLGADAIILRNDPAAGNTPSPRQVYIAFDCSAENTNLPLTQQYVVLMGNIFRWLVPANTGQTIYERPANENFAADTSSNFIKKIEQPREDFQLWGYLTAVAILLWLTGWALVGVAGGGKTASGNPKPKERQ